MMKKITTKEISLSGVLIALAVVGSFISFPIFGSKCAPVQHMVNIIAAVILGPFHGVVIAFIASLIRYISGLGTILAFPGSIFGALIAGIVYYKTKNLIATGIGEVFGTGILGALVAYPLAKIFLGEVAGNIAFYTYIIPFLISTIGGSIIALVLIYGLKKAGVIDI
ncbi:MAG: energy coupling factor transporter S component ThiW [Andreesenia angusta]|nr:energy coupling factor transporter S component ThiW [Andreesenia angusta]